MIESRGKALYFLHDGENRAAGPKLRARDILSIHIQNTIFLQITAYFTIIILRRKIHIRDVEKFPLKHLNPPQYFLLTFESVAQVKICTRMCRD